MASIQFTLRDLLWLVAKAALLLPAVSFMSTPIESCGAMAAVMALVAAEFLISARASQAPTVFRLVFFISRLTFGYAVVLSMDLVFVARHIPPVSSLRDAVGQIPLGILAGMLLALSLLASAISCFTALVAWPRDSRARWLAYVNGACLITAAAIFLFAP